MALSKHQLTDISEVLQDAKTQANAMIGRQQKNGSAIIVTALKQRAELFDRLLVAVSMEIHAMEKP